jgi:hypothetical protein
VFLAAVGLVLGMHRGLLLSSDIRSSRFPWAPFFPERHIQAPALSDPVWQFVPWLRLARRELAAGRIPLWNPHQDAGAPLLGNAQSGLLSPLNWPVLLFDADPGWNLSLLLRIAAAALGAYFWLRDLGRSRISASLGAAAFALSGAFVAWLEHPLAVTAAPAPWVLLFARRVARGGSARAVAGLAVATFFVIAGGHPETALMTALLALLVVVSAAPRGQTILRAAGGALLGAGLAAPMLLPFAEYFRLSAARLGEGRRSFVLAARDLLRFVAPRLPGSNVIEAAATVSVVVLLLLPFGLWAGRRERTTRAWALAAVAMLAVVYDNPIARAVAPLFHVYWTRFLLFLPLALAAVASRGLDGIRDSVAARWGPTASRAAGAAAVVLAAAELFAAARGVHGVTPAAWLAPRTPMLEKLAADRDAFRILPLHTMLSPDSATDYALDDVRGYDALAPAAWRRARSAMGRFADVPTQRDAIAPWDLAAGGAALDDWNVKYLLLAPSFAFGARQLDARKGLDLEEVYSGPDGRLLENRRAKPRVRLTGAGEARILGRGPGFWAIEVRAEAPTTLVVADPFFPGWRFRLDGRAAGGSGVPGEPMTLAVPAGAHRVELRYAPASFTAGVAIAAVCLAVAVWLARGSRRSDPSAAAPA